MEPKIDRFDYYKVIAGIFLCFFITLIFGELLYWSFFSLRFNFSKILYLLLYSAFFTGIISIFHKRKIRIVLLGFLLFFISAIYFLEASYFNLFNSFALWSQVLRVDELVGIKGTLGDFINKKFFIFYFPFCLFVILQIINKIIYSKNEWFQMKQKLSWKLKIALCIIPVLLINTLTFVYFSIFHDQNKLFIKNTTDYVRNYSLVDAFFVNSFSPVIKPFLKNNQINPQDIENAFKIHQIDNEQTNQYVGKNLVFIEAESIASYAIDEQLTPMLYKLQTEGYNFENYYSSRTNTFASEYALLNSFYLTPEKEALPYSSKNSMPGLFSKQNYSTQSFHNFMPEYYKRNEKMLELGFDAFYGSNQLGIVAEQPDFPSDIELFENSFGYIEHEEPFLAYYITVTAHGGYNAEVRPRLADNLEVVQSVYPNYDEKLQTYLASAMMTDQGVANLYENLAKNGLLQDTVIILVGDHYPYAIPDDILMDTFDINEPLDIYQVPCIIWDYSKPSTVISNNMSNVDVLPTVSNLFGLDLQYGMGKDIFSPQKEGIFIEWYDNRSYSFMTADGGYDDLTGKVTGNLSRNEVRELKKITYRREEWNNSEYLCQLLSDEEQA